MDRGAAQPLARDNPLRAWLRRAAERRRTCAAPYAGATRDGLDRTARRHRAGPRALRRRPGGAHEPPRPGFSQARGAARSGKRRGASHLDAGADAARRRAARSGEPLGLLLIERIAEFLLAPDQDAAFRSRLYYGELSC